MESTHIYSSELSPSLRSYIPTTAGDVCPSCNSESLCSDTVDLTHCSLKSTERQPLTPPGSHADLMQSIHQHIQTIHHYTSFTKRSHKILWLAQNKTPNPTAQQAAVFILSELPQACRNGPPCLVWEEKEESKGEEISRHGPYVC